MENQYGSEVYTIEFPPCNFTRSLLNPVPNRIHSLANNEFTLIRVYNSSGYYVKTIKEDAEIEELSSGMYILEYFQGNSKVKTSKLLK